MANQVQARDVRTIVGGLCLLVFLLMLAWGGSAQAQEGCVGPEWNMIEAAWAWGSFVTVNISPDFTPGEKWAIQDGISAWRNAGGSHVRFRFIQQETSIRGQRNTIQVNSEPIPPDDKGEVPRAYAELSEPIIGQPLQWAQINIQTGLGIDLSALASLVSHENGHTFGLLNCSYCPPGTSAMGYGGLPGPGYCDEWIVALGIRPPGSVPTPSGPLGRPEGSYPCMTWDCVWTQICYSTEGHTRAGEDAGKDVWCDYPELHCRPAPGWCTRASGEVGASGSPCGLLTQADRCEFDSDCCYDHTLYPPITVPTCDIVGRYAEKEVCEAESGAPCLRVFIQNSDCPPDICPPRTCWQFDAPVEPTQSCGAMGGDYCSQSGVCPQGYNSLGISWDCNPCCKSDSSLQSCGAMGGDYCSQTNTCPAGYESLGQSSDCRTCCRQGPSCGAMGGDYCSQSGSCPGGFDRLGRTWDCNPCCKSLPDPCGGDPCCGDPCCGDPCCGDPCCGDPCCGDPCCGAPCY